VSRLKHLRRSCYRRRLLKTGCPMVELSVAEKLAQLEQRETNWRPVLTTGHQEQSLRALMAKGDAALSPPPAKVKGTAPKKKPIGRTLVVAATLAALGLIAAATGIKHHRAHLNQIAAERAQVEVALYQHQTQLEAAKTQADAQQKAAALQFAAQSPELNAALTHGVCPLGQKPSKTGFEWGPVSTTLDNQGHGTLVVAHDAAHDVSAVIDCQ
jgi:hypothetical protein